MRASSDKTCPRCGTPLSPRAPEGLCPRCVVELNLQGDSVFAGTVNANLERAPSVEDLAPHFPHLEVVEYLGRGGMGVVYKARQKTLNRPVALKLLAPERVTDVKFAERFAQEAKALAALSHPNIVTVYDFGQAGGFYYLLMEYVDGVNLRQAMKAGRFTPEQALSIVPPVCEGLQYAHDHGIAHRDIKPENLLLDREGRVKIADFGIAKMLDTVGDPVAAAESQPAGTPQYMAPEQRELSGHAGTRADIYSLGVVLYEMLTGELPGTKLQPPSRRIQVDVRIDEIVLRALEVKPDLRYATAADFRADVENATARAEHSRRAGQASTWNGTRRVAGAVAVVIFFLALPFGVWAAERFDFDSSAGFSVLLLLLTFQSAVWARRLARGIQSDANAADIRRRVKGVGKLKLAAGFAWLLAVPAVLLGSYFLQGLVQERGTWNPAIAEAFVVPLAWLGALALPCVAIFLSREAARMNPRPSTPYGWVTRVLRVVVIVFCVGVTLFAVSVLAYLMLARSAPPPANVGGNAPASSKEAQADSSTPLIEENKNDQQARRSRSEERTPPGGRVFPLRHRLASDMLNDLRPLVPSAAGVELSIAENNQEVRIKAPVEIAARVGSFITVIDWPDGVRNMVTGQYLSDTVIRTARSFFHACATEESVETFSKLLSPYVLAELKGEPRTEHYQNYMIGGAPDPAWEASLRGDWRDKKEAIQRLIREWNRYPLKRIVEDPGVAIGFGVKHFCSVSFEGAPKEFYQVTIEPDRMEGRGSDGAVFFFSSLPPWWDGEVGERKQR